MRARKVRLVRFLVEESLSADLAGNGELLVVDLKMRFQVQRGLAAFTARAALERFGIWVGVLQEDVFF